VVSEPAPPDPFADTFVAIAAARAVIAATRLGLFEALAAAPATARDLAARQGLDPVGTEALLGALAALGYLELDRDGLHRPTEAAARLLVGASADSIVHFVGGYNRHAWDMLGRLEDLLQGEARPPKHELPPGDPFWEAYIRGLFELSRAEHAENAALVAAENPVEMLDVAGGHGGFAMAMCERHPRLRATVLDLPASVRVGRAIVEEQGLAGRVEFREGDAVGSDLGSGLDVISAFNLLHHLPSGAVRKLLARARDALRPGGRLVIGETERPEAGEPAAVNAAVSAVVYYVSSGTRNYTRAELTGFLDEAGLAEVRAHRNQRSPWRLLYLAHT
jgi:SAM-dependent methyltransferase